MKSRKFILLGIFVLMSANIISAAHYIVGYVEDALDGENANGKTIVLWNEIYGFHENAADIIGPLGNSGTDNIYMIDCESLSPSCKVGDILSLKIIDNGDGYVSETKNVTVTGAGYTLAEEIRLNSIPLITSVEIDDEFLPPTYQENEIDLNAGGVREVFCRAIAFEYDGADSLENANARIFHNSVNYESTSHKNNHYSNDSCYLNTEYGTEEQAEIICTFEIWYYASPGEWNCTVEISDNLLSSSRNSSTVKVNELLAIYVNPEIDYGELDADSISDEKNLQIFNYGNTQINISLSGYGENEEGDDFAMVCFSGEIPIYYQKYNLTQTNAREMTMEQFEERYINLTSEPFIREFNLDYRKNEVIDDAFRNTFWRIFAPATISGACEGRIVVGAVKKEAD
jgi:hypothetical protein